jgi:hypothetical protein
MNFFSLFKKKYQTVPNQYFLKKLKPKLFNFFFKKSFDIVHLKSVFTDILDNQKVCSPSRIGHPKLIFHYSKINRDKSHEHAQSKSGSHY